MFRTIFGPGLVPIAIVGLIVLAIDPPDRNRKAVRITAIVLLAAALLVLSPILLFAYALAGIGGVLEVLFVTGFWVVLPLFLLFGLNQLVGSFTSVIDGGNEEPDAAPFYNIARLCRKRGDPDAARRRTEEQLEKFPGDLEGQMLLAEILAEDFEDLAGAQRVVEQIIQQKGHSPENKARALFRLADWHLNPGNDRRSAQAALMKIMELFPDTDLARAAWARLSDLR